MDHSYWRQCCSTKSLCLLSSLCNVSKFRSEIPADNVLIVKLTSDSVVALCTESDMVSSALKNIFSSFGRFYVVNNCSKLSTTIASLI
jgi:hypothetical protein